MSWTATMGGHGNQGSATIYAPYKQPYSLTSLPLDELAAQLVAYLKQANQEAAERESAEKDAAEEKSANA